MAASIATVTAAGSSGDIVKRSGRAVLRSEWLAPVALLLLPFVVYWRFLRGDELANADVFLAYRPAHAWLAAALRAGHLPLWNPYLLGGFPLAFSEYGWFSPLNWAPLVLFGPHTGFYLAVALIYLALTTISIFVLRLAERRYSVGTVR